MASGWRPLVVNSLSGPLCTISAHASLTVFALKRAVESKTGIGILEQRLVFGARELNYDHDTASWLSSAGPCSLTLLRRDSEQVSWLQRFSKAGWREAYLLFGSAPEHIRASRDIVRVAINQNYSVFGLASEDIRADREFINDILKRKGTWVFKFSSETLLRDRSFVLSTAHSNNEKGPMQLKAILESAGEELWSDREFVLEAVKLVPQLIEKASHDLRVDSSLMLAVVERSKCASNIIQCIPDTLLSDRSFVLAAARKTRWILPHVPVQLCTEVYCALNEERAESSALLARQARQTVATPRAPRAQALEFPECHGDPPRLLDLDSFKELRAARHQRQGLRKCRRTRNELGKKTRNSVRPGPKKAAELRQA